MADKKQKDTRIQYHLSQLVPVGKELAVIVIIATSLLMAYVKFPNTHFPKDKITTLMGLSNTVTSLNSQKQTYTNESNNLQSNIATLKQKRENEGSLRFYIKDLSAYCRYVESVALNFGINVINLDIDNASLKVNYVVLGDYANVINFLNALETREIYYIENLKLSPSLANSGVYVSFSSNFNLDQTLIDRYSAYAKDVINPPTVIGQSPTNNSNPVTQVPSSTDNPSPNANPTTEQPFESITPTNNTSNIINNQLQQKDTLIVN